MKTKRNVVILALGIVSVLLFSTFAIGGTAADSPNMEKLFGSWNAEVTVVAQNATFPALLTFGAEGSVIADEPPSPGETSGHGNWVSSGDGQAAYTFVALYSGEGGAYAGRLKVVGTLQYDASADTWQGPFKIGVFDADGQVTLSDQGTFNLTRIAVEPLD